MYIILHHSKANLRLTMYSIIYIMYCTYSADGLEFLSVWSGPELESGAWVGVCGDHQYISSS